MQQVSPHLQSISAVYYFHSTLSYFWPINFNEFANSKGRQDKYATRSANAAITKYILKANRDKAGEGIYVGAGKGNITFINTQKTDSFRPWAQTRGRRLPGQREMRVGRGSQRRQRNCKKLEITVKSLRNLMAQLWHAVYREQASDASLSDNENANVHCE